MTPLRPILVGIWIVALFGAPFAVEGQQAVE